MQQPIGLPPGSSTAPHIALPDPPDPVAAQPRPESQDEVSGSRLANFLSDDVAPEGRDSDATRSGRRFVPATVTDSVPRSLHDESAPPPPREAAAHDTIPAPLRSGNQVVAASPVESAIRSVLERQAETPPPMQEAELPAAAQNAASVHAVAQYTNVQDVLTRLSA